jgi:competence protein ComEA
MPPGPRFLTLPAALRGARVTGPRAAAAGLLLVLVVAGGAFGARVAWARASSAPHVVAPAAPGSTRGSALGVRTSGHTGFASVTATGGAGGPPATSARITVHVVGQVKAPGVFELPLGSRVEDAVERAGGARSGADLGAINLARPLVDGEQVRVPKPGEAVAAAPRQGAGPGSGVGAGGSGASAPGGLLNLNTATGAQLEDLPGVGPVLAQRIVDWRTEHGRFTSVDELGEVSGIGEKMLAQLQPKVTV